MTHFFSYIRFVRFMIYPKDHNIYWTRYMTWLAEQSNLMWRLSVDSRYNMSAPLVLRANSVTPDPPLNRAKYTIDMPSHFGLVCTDSGYRYLSRTMMTLISKIGEVGSSYPGQNQTSLCPVRPLLLSMTCNTTGWTLKYKILCRGP